MGSPAPHPQDLTDLRWVPPADQDIVRSVTKHLPEDTIVIYEPNRNPTPWIKATEWYPLSEWR